MICPPPHNCEPMCEPCISAGARDISLLPLDYYDLKRDIARKNGASDTKISRPVPRSTPPIDLNVDALAREIAWTLSVWEPAVREAADLSPPIDKPVREGYAVSKAVAVIAPRVSVLAALPVMTCYADGLEAGPVDRDGRYAVAQLRQLHRRSRNVLGLNQLVVHLPGECSGCGAWLLRRRDGSETVWCDACERTWTYDDYRRYVGLMLVDPTTLGVPRNF